MQRDSLEQLLLELNRQTGQSALSPDELAERVYRLQRKRKRVARGTLGIAACVILAGFMKTRFTSVHDAPQPVTRDVASIDRELHEIKAEADRIRLEFTELTDQVTGAGKDEVGRRSNEIRDERLERSACLIAYRGDRYYHEFRMYDQAAASYRQILDLFPHTRAAQTARSRLTELENAKETPS